nr:hypothetical protein [Rhizobium gallicum]
MPVPHRAVTIHEDPSAVIGVDACAIADAKIKDGQDRCDGAGASASSRPGPGSLGTERRPESFAPGSVSGCYVRLRSTVDPATTGVPCEDCPQVPVIRIHISSGK